jgi:putative ABC transport system permease protein
MSFVVTMAVREIRASWRRLLFFFVCIAIGVASIVAIRSVIQNVRAGLTAETRALTGGDVVISGNAPFTPKVLEALADQQKAGRVSLISESVEMPTMVRAEAGQQPVARMVELLAVQAPFPLYGTLELQQAAYSHALLQNRGVLVRPELLVQLNVGVGDRIMIGDAPFEIRGVIEREPGRNVGSFSLGSRILIDHADLEATGLLAFGSRTSRRLLLKVAGADTVPTRVARELLDRLSNEFVRVRSYRQVENDIGEDLERAENYLSLVGLVVLILGGIGVSSVTRVFVQQKVRSIAILKCIGATSRDVLSVYMTQIVALGLAGSALGVAIAAAAVAALPAFVPRVVAMLPADYGLTLASVAQGMGIGLLVSVLFSIVPLLEVRTVKPSRLLRQDATPAAGIDWLKWGIAGGVGAALVGLAAWQAGSIMVGLVLSAGFIGIAIVLQLAGMALVRAVQPLRYARSFALRQAVLHVARPGNQTRVILLAVGLGTFFVLGVRGLQANLLRDFSVQLGENSPDMFLLDIQSDQRDGVTALVDAANGAAPPPALIPVLRARIVGVRGSEVNLENYEAVRGRGGLSREYTITYRPTLNPNETLVDGSWWDDTPVTSGAEVSIEESLRRRFQIQIGDEMRFDVLGREITARVTSTREVDFRDARAGGFMLVFRPGTFDSAPHTYIASVRGPDEAASRTRMQGLISGQYPNVSVIDLREVLRTVEEVVNNVTMAVTVVGGLVLLSGSLILIGAVSMTKFRRVYEAAILKTLGASSRLITLMLLLEYGVLGAIAGTVGALGAVVLSWAVATYALELTTWEAAPLLTVTGIVATAVFVAIVGVVASYDVLRHKPLSTLRAE